MVSDPESPSSRFRALVPKRGWFLLPRSDNRHSPRLRFGVQLGLFVLLGVAVLVGSGWLLLHGIGGALRLGRLGASEQLDIVKIALSVVAGVGGVIALTVAYRKQKLGEAAEARAEAAHQREETKLYTERFGACVAQLGDDNPAVRLGGAYALVHLADDWDEGRQTCIDVLCAQLRMPYPADQPDDPEEHAKFLALREVRHSISRLIGDHLCPDATERSWDGYNFNFAGATIDRGDFQGISLTSGKIDFSSAEFSGGEVTFEEAEFSGGEIRFDGARFSGGEVSFDGTRFSGGDVSFDDAKFSGGEVTIFAAEYSGARVIFTGAEYSRGKVSFDGGGFSGGKVFFTGGWFSGGEVRFFDAKFSGGEVTFFDAKFSGGEVTFAGAEFSSGEASFDRAEFSRGEVTFAGAEFSGGKVTFGEAKFAGGIVDISAPANFQIPPVFDAWSVQPQGLLLP
jgi:uncharacterized protein YjbI with pentapeptide repeats